MKLAIARVHFVLPSDCRLLLSVHDSVLIEAPAGRVEEVVMAIRREMEAVPSGFTVPLKVEVKVGNSWGQMQVVEILNRKESQ